jgi:toxin ParE1/3/4
MSLAYHPLVQREVNAVLRRYDGASARLGDEFWAELMRVLRVITENPEHFRFSVRDLRRANLKRFPYHVLYRVAANGVRVVVIRHNKRHPAYGVRRR